MAVCREVRKFSAIPIIMVTAKVEEIDRLLGLELGADDYICKPFSPREVVARVRAVLRRTHPQQGGTVQTAGPLALDEETHRVRINNSDLPVTPSEFKLLQVLMTQPGRVFSRDELLRRMQGYGCEGYDRTIDSHIKNLRKKMMEKLPNHELIVTVYGVGYTLNIAGENKQ
jgi:two-component system, OmpR family, response regulator BaeR